MFKISSEPILVKELAIEPSAGAVVSFEGVVRDRNEGKSVRALQYEAMDELACKEGNRILAEAKEKFSIDFALCVHRTGLLHIGETAILVQVSAGHRQAAFDACRYIVDEVKSRVPIWKKELYETGETGWINSGEAGAS